MLIDLSTADTSECTEQCADRPFMVPAGFSGTDEEYRTLVRKRLAEDPGVRATLQAYAWWQRRRGTTHFSGPYAATAEHIVVALSHQASQGHEKGA